MKLDILIELNLILLISSLIMLVFIGYYGVLPIGGQNLLPEEKESLLPLFIILPPILLCTLIIMLIDKYHDR